MRRLGLPFDYAFSEVMGFDEDLLAFVPQPVVAVLCNLNFLKKTEDLERGDPNTQVNFYMK